MAAVRTGRKVTQRGLARLISVSRNTPLVAEMVMDWFQRSWVMPVRLARVFTFPTG